MIKSEIRNPVTALLFGFRRNTDLVTYLFPSFFKKVSLSNMSQDFDPRAMLKRRLLRGEITYAAAKEQDANILHQLGYREKKIRYFTHLYRNRQQIKSIVAHHLGLSSADRCRIVDVEDWIHGSFNVCIRVDVDGRGGYPGKQAMIRFPLPYRIGEDCCPGNADEKVRCEVGTYAWLQENCPTVPIPRLYGFGLSTGETVRPPPLCVLHKTPLLTILVYYSR
jgi:hypothetical protein